MKYVPLFEIFLFSLQLMGGCEKQPCIQETIKKIEVPHSRSHNCSSPQGVVLNRIDLYSEHSGIWSGASGGNGGQSGGCRVVLGSGRCCQRIGGLCGSGRQHCDHRGQLPPRPNTSALISSSTSAHFIEVGARSRQKHGMLSQSQQRVRLRHGPRPDCWPAGVAAAKNTLTATTPRRPPCHRGNPPSGNYRHIKINTMHLHR